MVKQAISTEKTSGFDLADYSPRHRWRSRPPKQFPSPWASEWGCDQYGLWQTFSINGIHHKMRFIPRGEFLMGSPEDEPERRDNELQHKVILTQSFWLGETPVTQALWQAVMGNNPSGFTPKGGKQFPVERVSWDDCQQFFNQVSELLPSLSINLPTEAQWEYACRAGSQTPFNTGEQLTTDQANYNGNYSYKGRVELTERQIFRARTVDVHRFSPNSWGLKQMHGNVWEWCQDGPREYRAEVALDPVGPGEQSDRALRGGGWLFNGWYCRSAYRHRYVRDRRDGYIGLRAQVLD